MEGNPGINQQVPEYGLLSTDGILLESQDPGMVWAGSDIPTQAHPVPPLPLADTFH